MFHQQRNPVIDYVWNSVRRKFGGRLHAREDGIKPFIQSVRQGYWGYYLSTRQIKNKVLFIPYYFLFMNVNVLKGIGYLKRKKGSGAWEKAKRAEK